MRQTRSACAGLVLGFLVSAGNAHAQGARPSFVDARDSIVSFAVGGWGFSLMDRDLATRPGDDFVRHVAGRWYDENTKQGLDRNNSYWRDLMRLPTRRVARILQELGNNRSLSPGSPEGKAAAFYRSFVDTTRIKRGGLAPLEPALALIRRATTHADIARAMGTEAGAWTPRPVSVAVQTFPLGLFSVHVIQDPRHVTQNTVLVGAAGILLPAPSYYSDPKQADIREAYEQYIAGMLGQLHWDRPKQRARDVLALETRLAAASWSLDQRVDIAAQINPMTVSELKRFAPAFDWTAFLAGAGLASVNRVIIDTKSAFPELARIFAETPIEVWQARQAFAIADQDAPKLDAAAAALAREFRVKRFQGTAASQPRDFRIVLNADATIPDIIGTLYTKRYFTPEIRTASRDMARGIRDAFDARLASSPYLSDASKKRARAKLAAMMMNIGSPDKTRDYSSLALSDSDYFGNLTRARTHEWRRQIATLDRPFDRTVFPLRPYDANYAYIPTSNVMGISAAALEPPFFDPTADPAVNYGAIGTLIGSTMAAAFARSSTHFGPHGELTDVFTADEMKRLGALRDSIVAQLSSLEPVPGLHLQGELIADEDIADIIGVQIALDAYHASLAGKPAPVIDGTTGDQRFFLGRAQMWRAAFVPNFLRGLVANGHNTPPNQRINFTVRFIDAWYTAFDIHSEDRMYLEPPKRLHFLF